MKRRNDELRSEIALYFKNKADFWLVMLFLLLNLIATVHKLNAMAHTYWMFVEVMYTICITLLLFLASSAIKVYRTKYSFVVLVCGILQFVRMFFLGEVEGALCPAMLASSGILGVAIAVSSYLKSRRYQAYLKIRKQLPKGGKE